MNSYPSEFITQLGPVMYVAGLDITAEPQQSDTETSEDDRILGKRLQADPFSLLAKRLREVLLEKSIKKGIVWIGDVERGAPGFRMIMVDKNVRFPPQKAVGQDAHSPLSPLTQSSPLYPDGLIAPIWVRKHTELLPSVFVLFLRLYELVSRSPASPISPLHNQVINEKEEERRREEERKRDSELSVEIAARKRTCTERGIKLTVVLMASRKMLDDPNLDSRLTFIRKQSGLDSRAALFVLSPVNPTELQEFVKSLQSALHDPALEYYVNHSKRVRRKRNRHTGTMGSTTTYSHAANLGSAYTPRAPVQPLRPQGWLVRYEYKMACFAEFRGEEEVARKHFQTSWEILLDMFGSTAILPPRTKRWAEAKVLADCISLKIIKLYLYRSEHSRAMAHFNAHLTRFADLSRGWGIGEETWEFWSWIARWYRILAELLDMAMLSTLKIPQYLPSFPIRPATPPATHQPPTTQFSLESTRPNGYNPSSVLQHAGYYYYAAAICTQRRLEQFMIADQEAQKSNVAAPANLANERKVDHRVIILELYTKAYELFKKYSYGQGQSRLTFYIASRIAQTYRDSGKYDMAVRFFERIAKSYRKEQWDHLLKPLLSMWYSCARQMGDIDSTVRLLIEMMCSGPPDDFEQGQLEEDLTAVLTSTSPSVTPYKIDFSDSHTLFITSVVFWRSEVAISQPAPFQLQLQAPSSVSLAALPFVSLRVEFSDNRSPVTIRHSLPPDGNGPRSSQVVDLGSISYSQDDRPKVTADLRWPAGGIIVLTGILVSDVPTTLGISKLVFNVAQSHWNIELTFDMTTAKGLSPARARWLSCSEPLTFLPLQVNDPSTTKVRHRPHLIDVSLSHPAPAYVDEEYPVVISVKNIDDHDLRVVVDVLLQPAEDDTVNHITFGSEHSTGLIKGVSYGLLGPGETAEQTLLLHSTGAPGDRTLDISVQCEHPGLHVTENMDSPTSPRPAADVSESLHTLVIPTFLPLDVESVMTYHRATLSSPLPLADLKAYDTSSVEAQTEVMVRTSVITRGPWDITIETIKFLPAAENEKNEGARILGSSLDGDADEFPMECQAGDIYSVTSRFMIFAQDAVDLPEVLSSPGEYEVKWSRTKLSESSNASAITRIPLPQFEPPRDNLEALVEMPASGLLHVPITITLKIRNRHPWRTADLHLQMEPSDHFVFSGLRSGSLPVLLAGGQESLDFNLIPISCGTARLPAFKLLDRRKDHHEPQNEDGGEVERRIPVIDARIEERNGSGDEIRLMVRFRGEGGTTRLRKVDADGLSMFIAPA